MVANVDDIYIDLKVLLGTTQMPLHQLLRMGRGAIIELDADVDEDCEIWANDIPIAKGKVILEGQMISINITEILTRRPDYREPHGIVHIPKSLPLPNHDADSSAEVNVDNEASIEEEPVE